MTLDPKDYRSSGQFVEALLEERNWTQTILAVVLGVDNTTIHRLVRNKRRIDARLALALSEVSGVPADEILDLQKRYDLARAEIEVSPDPYRATRAHLFGSLPIAEMITRGWLSGVEDIRDMPAVEAALTRFFGVESVNEIETLPHAAKRTNVAGDVTAAQLAWLYRVRAIASGIWLPRYSRDSGRSAVKKLDALLGAAEEVRKAPRILAEAGIRFVIVESLPSTKIDGVCCWLDQKAPVIAISLRFDRIDNFWFVLRHELEHVLRGHGREAIKLDASLEGERAGTGPNISEEERIANQAAADFCVPRKNMDEFISRKSPFFSERDILGFARTLKVHPGLVAGQLQHRTGRYDRFRNHLVKIRSLVTPSAVVDGWGDVAPVGA